MNESNSSNATDPFTVLGLDKSASEPEIRQRYLDLVRQHPPEADPVRFREIHSAYESAKDPLILAERLLRPAGEIPPWQDVIEQQRKSPPMLTAKMLFALGNKPQAKPDNAK